MNTRSDVIDARELVGEIRRWRAAGRVHCAVDEVDTDDPDEALFQLVGIELPEGWDGWRPVDAGHAERIVQRILHRDLAYDGAIMPAAKARELARRFVALAPPGARILTNAPDLAEAPSRWSFTPATGAAYDAGVLVLGDYLGAVVWVEDDD